MGVQLSDLTTSIPLDFQALMGKRIAIDAMNSLYQFLSIIRQPTGELLQDRKGRVTSHLSGLLYRNANLVGYGIFPIYVFDGKPPALKGRVVEKRKEARDAAGEKWRQALKEGRLVEAKTYAMQASRFTADMLADSKELLQLLGIPWVQAPSEGEAQAAKMVAAGDAWAVGSQDYDSLLFGSPRLIRNLTISGKRKLPRKNIYVDVKPEILYLDQTLKELGITREQLIEVSILIGTDFNPGGIEGIGPKKAYALIKEYSGASEALKAKGIEPGFNAEEIKELFLKPETVGDYSLQWRPPSREKVMAFLCDERDFSSERVQKALEKFETAHREFKSQASLDAWFS